MNLEKILKSRSSSFRTPGRILKSKSSLKPCEDFEGQMFPFENPREDFKKQTSFDPAKRSSSEPCKDFEKQILIWILQPCKEFEKQTFLLESLQRFWKEDLPLHPANILKRRSSIENLCENFEKQIFLWEPPWRFWKGDLPL